MNLNLDSFFKLEHNSNLILINAHEDYTAVVTYCTDLLKNQLQSSLTNPETPLSVHKINVDRYFNFESVQNILNSTSLFDEINYIELNYKTKPTSEHQEWLGKICNNLPDNNILVISCDGLNKRDLGTKWVKDIAQVGNLLTLGEESLIPLIKHVLQQKNLTITPDGLKILLEQNHSNATQLLQELNQLAIYYPSGTSLNAGNIQDNTNNNAKYSIYSLSNAYLAGDLKSSMLILDNIYHANEDAILINWIINEDIRKLLKIKSKLRNNNNITQCMREVGVWGDAVNYFPTANQRMSYKTLTEILKMLSQLDFIIKGVENGSTRDQIIQILIKITNNKNTQSI